LRAEPDMEMREGSSGGEREWREAAGEGRGETPGSGEEGAVCCRGKRGVMRPCALVPGTDRRGARWGRGMRRGREGRCGWVRGKWGGIGSAGRARGEKGGGGLAWAAHGMAAAHSFKFACWDEQWVLLCGWYASPACLRLSPYQSSQTLARRPRPLAPEPAPHRSAAALPLAAPPPHPCRWMPHPSAAPLPWPPPPHLLAPLPPPYLPSLPPPSVLPLPPTLPPPLPPRAPAAAWGPCAPPSPPPLLLPALLPPFLHAPSPLALYAPPLPALPAAPPAARLLVGLPRARPAATLRKSRGAHPASVSPEGRRVRLSASEGIPRGGGFTLCDCANTKGGYCRAHLRNTKAARASMEVQGSSVCGNTRGCITGRRGVTDGRHGGRAHSC
jgi:hypothetical protein